MLVLLLPCDTVRLQLPQYYRNYKTKSAEALSPWFLAQWLLVSVTAACRSSRRRHMP